MLLVVLVAVVGLYAQHALALLSVRAELRHQQAADRQLAASNAALVRQQRALQDPATIVRDARVLGMVRMGERPYVVTGFSH